MKWFRHELESIESDQIFELIETHSFQGYGVWWYVVEQCYKAEETGFQVEVTDVWLRKAARKGNLTDWRTIPRILDTMSDVGLIDSQLWAEHVIHIPGIQKRADGYMKKKEQDAKRAKKYREAHKNVTHDASVTDEGEEESCVTPCDIAKITPPDLRLQTSDLRLQTSDLRSHTSEAEQQKSPIRSSLPRKENSSEEETEPADISYPSHADKAASLVKAKATFEGKNSAPRPVDFDKWVQAYCEHRPKKWAGVLTLSPDDVNVIRGAIAQVGDEASALEMFIQALDWVKADPDPFWRERSGDISTLLKAPKMHFIKHSALARQNSVPPAPDAATETAEQRIRRRRAESRVDEAKRLRNNALPFGA